MLKVCGILLFVSALAMPASAKPEKPPKDLLEYIQLAKQAGTNVNDIRRNVLGAGWDPKLVEEAFAVVERGDSSDQKPGEELPNGYRIGPGDVLNISVFREPDASVPAATVRADGKISLPLIKEVEVVGLTAAEAEKLLAEKLSRYIHAADVTVIVSQINSRKIYLVGGLRAVGAFDLKGPMTVLQAITQAGGVTEYAKRKQIYILRVENGKQVKLPFNYDAVIKGESMLQNIQLLPNDTIVVPQ
jgi:polysaccharide biosynthesis/export protein